MFASSLRTQLLTRRGRRRGTFREKADFTTDDMILAKVGKK